MKKFQGYFSTEPLIETQEKDEYDELAVVGPGHTFGELSMIIESSRAATTIAETTCHLGVLTREKYREILAHHERKEFEEKLELFKTHFNVILSSRREVAAFVINFKPIRSVFRESVYKEGDYPEHVYIVVKGVFKVLKTEQKPIEIPELSLLTSLYRSRVEKSIVEVITLERGSLFGEYEPLNGSKVREFSIECASSEGEYYKILIADLQKVFKGKNLKEILNFKDKKKYSNSFISRKRVLSADAKSQEREKIMKNLRVIKIPKGPNLIPMQKSIMKKLNFSNESFHLEEKSALLARIMNNRKEKLEMPPLTLIMDPDQKKMKFLKIKLSQK